MVGEARLDPSNGNRVEAYDPGVTELILAEAANIIRASGFAAHHLTIIGGLVPSLLVPVLDPDARPHVGTTDIDLCLSLALIEGDTDQYERLERVLTDLGFEMSDATFRWVRRSGLHITLEFFCPASQGRPAGKAFRPKANESPNAKHNLGGKLSALSLDAGSLLVRDVEVVRRTVQLPDDRGEIEFDFRVTGPIAFLIAKVEALRGRDKPKDAYDIVWLIENWPGGPGEAAVAFGARPAYDAGTRQRLLELERLFRDTDQVGARSYGRFISQPATRALDERQAVGAVHEFVAALPE